MKRKYSIIVVLLMSLIKTEAIDISAVGGWNELINESDLISGAGSDLVDTYESAVNATILTISLTTGNTDNWRVDVKRVDSAWNSDFTLYVKRTSDGTGGGYISGGLSYIQVTTTDTEFFTGAGDRESINLQYKLTGMSINVSPANYNTVVTFTVVDLP